MEKKFVRIFNKGIIKEVGVEAGIRGSQGLVEITKGLREGDKIVVSEIETKKRGLFSH